MPPVSPADGPVAVTGASGSIGSWIVRDLMQQGYRVRACVRDLSNPAKVDHLEAMNDDPSLRGSVTLCEADLGKPGSYDEPFRGCCAVVHAGATVGYGGESPQQVYDGCFTEVGHVLDSVERAGSVRRFVFTSSIAAVIDPVRDGYVYTEQDWFSECNPAGWRGHCKDENIATDWRMAYSFAKMRAERMAYGRAAASGGAYEAMAILPVHTVGPVMCKNHDQKASWQNIIKNMLKNNAGIDKRDPMLWNMGDVRDVGAAHRLCLESSVAGNGSRYILGAADRSHEIPFWQLRLKLMQLFPMVAHVSGGPERPTMDRPRCYCLKAINELGLRPLPIDQSLRDTGDSYWRLGMLPQLGAASKL